MASSSSATESLSLQLLEAIADGDEPKAASLIDQGTDVNFVAPGTGDTCLAIAFENLRMVKLLLAKGADPNLRDGGGERPLFHVIGTGSVEIVKVLIDGGADVNALTGLLGQTLLSEAFLEDDLEVLKYLIQRGANPYRRSWERKENLWDFARKHGVPKQQLAEVIGYDLSKEPFWRIFFR